MVRQVDTGVLMRKVMKVENKCLQAENKHCKIKINGYYLYSRIVVRFMHKFDILNALSNKVKFSMLISNYILA